MAKEKYSIQKLNIIKSKGGIFPLLGVALIIFVLTVAVYFVADYVADSYQKDNLLSGWSYAYTGKSADVPEGKLRIFNAQNPIITEHSSRQSTLYLTRTITPEETGKNFVLYTDFSPVKIRLNGKDVYDNQFESEDYVGNCYNSFYLETSTHDQQMDIFIKLPFSVRFEVFLRDAGDPAYSFLLGFYFGAGLFSAGVLTALIFLIMSIIKKRFYRTVITASLAAYIGFAIIMHLLPECTYKLNLPVWLRITEICVQMTFMVTLLFLNGLFKNQIKTLLSVIFASGISIIAVMLSFSPLMVKISAVLMSVLCFFSVVFVGQRALALLDRRMQYATPVFVMCVFYALMVFFAGILLISRLKVLYIYTVAVSSVVVGSVLEYIYIHDYRFVMKTSELREQTVIYGNSVEYISVFFRNILSCGDKKVFFDAAVNEIRDLLVKYNEKNEDVLYCAAVKENGKYTQVLSNGVGICSYQLIENNSQRDKRNCLFCETFFEYVLRNGDDVGCIFHFENIKNGLDAFLISMLEAVYCGLETTYENLFVGEGRRDLNIIFEELAENAEIDNGCSIEHLSNICTYTKALCLRLGFDEEKAERISIASKLHDLGKIAVPKYIIEKKGRLNEEERVIISSHTEFGYTILSAYNKDPLIKTAALIARYHHEQYNGMGTKGLKGEEIPIEARIVTVCDVYDALVSERSYKNAWSKEEAMLYIADNAGRMFDPKISGEFIDYLRNK